MARTSFKFRLKRLLDVRIMREKQEQQTLIKLRQIVVEQEQILVQMQASEQRLREDQKRPLERGDDLQEFAHRRAWLEQAINENLRNQSNQQNEIRKAEAAVVAQQAVVQQAGIDVKALEKVQDKKREEHRLEELREEGLFMDDLAGQGFLRRRTNEQRVAKEEEAAG